MGAGIAGQVAYYCIRYLHRHPSEVRLSLDEIADVVAVGAIIDDERARIAEAGLGGAA